MTFRVAVNTDLLVVSGSPGGRMVGKLSPLLDDVPEVRLAGMAEIDMLAFAALSVTGQVLAGPPRSKTCTYKPQLEGSSNLYVIGCQEILSPA
jgi:hypothetical protein